MANGHAVATSAVPQGLRLLTHWAGNPKQLDRHPSKGTWEEVEAGGS